MSQVNRPDPAPSRWSYRLQRLMLTPMFHKLLRRGLPLALCLGAGVTYFADNARREAVATTLIDLRQQIETRPEFMVNLLAVEGASLAVEEDIRATFPFEFPLSSFDLDLDDIRGMIEDLPAVADASVRVRQGGVLVALVTERQPVALWRTREGLGVLDIHGVVIGEVAQRSDKPDLPVVAGQGADRAVAEAIGILQAAAPLEARLRGLVRVGERRWDLVLDRDQRIMLPETGPVRALERVILLNDVQDMMERDLVAVDMRLTDRPTIRMNARAVEEWWRVTSTSAGTE